MNPTVDISKLSAGFGKKILVRDFDLKITKGEMIGLIGRNGTGKTTLLKTIAGLIPKKSGSVTIDGMNTDKLSSTDRAKKTGIVLTSRIPLNGIDVQTLVSMGRFPHASAFGWISEHDKQMSAAYLERLGIAHLAQKPLGEISDGEMQKAMIARVLVQETPFIIMDEPTAYLDYIAKEELFALMREIVSTGKVCLLFSSHDMELVKKYADRVVEIGIL